MDSSSFNIAPPQFIRFRMASEPRQGWIEFDEISMEEGARDASASASPPPTTTATQPPASASLAAPSPVTVATRSPEGRGQKVADVSPSSRPAVISPRLETVMDPAKLAKEVEEEQKRIETKRKERDEMVNGKVLVSVWPENNSCAWLIPPRYNPYSMPSILASQGIQMLPDTYVMALEMITNDYRFRSYCALYGRLVAFWMTLSLVVLLVVLFSSPKGGLPVLIFCIVWCLVVLLGIVGCCVIRRQIRIGLRHAVQAANKLLLPFHVIAGVEDRGQISCHKVIIHLMYFNADDCLREIERQLRIRQHGGAVLGEVPPTSTVTPEKNAEEARNLLLKYSHGYVKDSCRVGISSYLGPSRLDGTSRIVFPSRPSLGVSDYSPLHCQKRLCLCQFVDKQHFNRKPKKWSDVLSMATCDRLLSVLGRDAQFMV